MPTSQVCFCQTNATLQKSIWIFFSFLLLKCSDSQVRILQGPFFFLLWFIAANYDLHLDFRFAPINGANAVQSNLFYIHTAMTISAAYVLYLDHWLCKKSPLQGFNAFSLVNSSGLIFNSENSLNVHLRSMTADTGDDTRRLVK